MTKKTLIIDARNAGLFSNLLSAVDLCIYSEKIGASPYIRWDGCDLYGGVSLWNNLFQPVGVPPAPETDVEIHNLGSNYRAGLEHRIVLEEIHPIHYLLRNRTRIYKGIKKYVKINDEIDRVINTYWKQFSKKTLGVHVRGTDRQTDYPLIPLPVYAKHISTYLEKNNCDTIFIATDSEESLNYILKAFPDIKIIYINATRTSSYNSRVGPHDMFNSVDLAKEALIDSILLSQCTHLIKNFSNLSLFSWYNNLNLTWEVLK